jgi:hypothetical protein
VTAGVPSAVRLISRPAKFTRPMVVIVLPHHRARPGPCRRSSSLQLEVVPPGAARVIGDAGVGIGADAISVISPAEVGGISPAAVGGVSPAAAGAIT